jgi:hypothetical protein
MDKRVDELVAALREIAASRDARLQDRPITSDRLERLHEILGTEFPLETALSETARRRDNALSPRARELTADVAAQLLEVETRSQTFACSPRSFATVLVRLRSALHTPVAIGAATAILLVAGLFVFENGRASDKGGRNGVAASADARSVETPQRPWRAGHFLTGPGSRLALQVSTNELAHLRPSLLTANRVFSPDLSEAKLNLRLDLPVSQILTEAGRSEMP